MERLCHERFLRQQQFGPGKGHGKTSVLSIAQLMVYCRAMKKLTAVIDKSMLQAICEQLPDKLDVCFNTLLGRYVLVVPSVLVEEVWVNLASPSPGKPPEVVERMVACLLHLQDAWIAEPLEIAFVELVKRESIDLLPRPKPAFLNSFHILRRDNAALIEWVKKRSELHKVGIKQRIQEQTNILGSKKPAPVANCLEFFEEFIRPQFLEILSDSDRKRKLLESVLGLSFRARHPDCSQEIDKAFEDYSLDTFDNYHATFNCIMSAMFYFYAPLCETPLPGGSPRKLLGGGFSNQRSNLNDEKYVQSALLCARLATCDEGMRNVMELFRACSLWNGQTIFVQPDSGKELDAKLLGAVI